MRNQLNFIVHCATVVAWIVAAIDISPWGFNLEDDRFLFVIAAACVSSYAWIARANARPVTETFLIGKEVGRREAMQEEQCENVTRMAERRLTVVGD